MKKSCLIIFILLMAILVGCGEEKGKKRKSSAEYYCFRYPDEEAPLTIT